MDIERSEWPTSSGYLNTAFMGLPPAGSVAAAQTVLNQWAHGAINWEEWLTAIEPVRRSFASLIGTSVDGVGIGHTTAGGVNLVASNLSDGSRVLICATEHNSNTLPLLAQRRRGIKIVTCDWNDISQNINAEIDALFVSLVQSLDGRIIDLETISSQCRKHGVLLCVDATQAIGWLPFDASLCDVIVCSSYKWLMGANGPSFIVLTDKLMPDYRQLMPNWFACMDPTAAPYGFSFEPAVSARKFDVVPALISMSALLPALKALCEIGVQQIYRHNLGLVSRFCQQLGIADPKSSIVIFEDAGAVACLREAGLRVGGTPNRARIAFHLYNTDEDVDRASVALKHLSTRRQTFSWSDLGDPTGRTRMPHQI